MHKIAYYISAHGYGHGVRSSDIIRALAALRPDAQILLITDLPESFLRNRLPGIPLRFRRGSFDIGMVQLDSIRVDVDETFRRVAALCEGWGGLVSEEARFLQQEEVDLVVADIAAIPMEAGRQAGIPVVAVANFAWDWIYEEFAEKDARWGSFVDRFSAGYRCSDLLLRLPFSEELRAFPRKVDIPLVASPGKSRREDLIRLTGASPDRTWVLLSFTTLDWNEDALARVEQLQAYEFFTVQPLEWRRRNIHPVNREDVPFSDVLASMDVVVSKPGFGLLSECVVNSKPLVYADRTDFREYELLVREMPRYLQCVHVDTQSLYRGELEEALERLGSQAKPPEHMPAGGADIAARHIAAFLK